MDMISNSSLIFLNSVNSAVSWEIAQNRICNTILPAGSSGISDVATTAVGNFWSRTHGSGSTRCYAIHNFYVNCRRAIPRGIFESFLYEQRKFFFIYYVYGPYVGWPLRLQRSSHLCIYWKDRARLFLDSKRTLGALEVLSSPRKSDLVAEVLWICARNQLAE